MEREWNQDSIQRYIDEEIEESLNLDYKAADALGRSDGKKREITKDVSAMANSDGGIIIYGIKERPDQKYLPEKIDPVDRTLFSKEWLEQVINTIRPRIDGLIVHPVPLDSDPNDVVYVVEIPQGSTAHQARDYKYYKRFNFESAPMEDYEVRDVMNRATTPDLAVEFGYQPLALQSEYHQYVLDIFVRNLGEQVVNNFQLEFTFPGVVPLIRSRIEGKEQIELIWGDVDDPIVVYRSKGVLFPEQELDIGREVGWTYQIDHEVYAAMRQSTRAGRELSVGWILYADNMKPKQGTKPFSELHEY